MYNLVWNHVRVFKMERVRSANDEQHKNEFRSKMHDTKLQLPIHHICILKQISSSKPILLNLTNQHKRRYVIITFSTFFSLWFYPFCFVLFTAYLLFTRYITFRLLFFNPLKIFEKLDISYFFFPIYISHVYAKISL